MTDNTLAEVRQYLNHHNVLCLATTHGNRPWVAPVFYATGNNGLIFLSAPHTRHCRNLNANPAVSGSIQEDYRSWNEIRGIQLEGTVNRIPETERMQAIECYSKKFPVTGDQAPPEIASALEKIHWFELIVTGLFYIDNSKGLGHRDQLDPALVFTAR